MKKLLSMAAVLGLAIGLATSASASERREQPDTRFVDETLKALGGEHYPEKMKVSRVTSIPVGDTYYHVFKGTLDTVGYHIIVFGNYKNYLGYYPCNFPPCNYEIRNSIVIDSGDVDADGDPLYYPIPVDEKKGLPGNIQIGGVPTKLVAPPKKEGEEEPADKPADSGKVEPEFREWTITHQGKPLTVRAIYIDQTFADVVLKGEGMGKTKPFPKSALSKEDREYIKQFE